MEVFKKVNQSILKFKKCINLTGKFFTTETKFQTHPYRLHRLDKSPLAETTITKEEALKYYRQMTTIRKLEKAIGDLYKSKKIRGFCHLYSGQEAVAVGFFSALRPQDSVITSYRCHAWTYLLCKENNILKIVTELLGYSQGVSRGKGGSMHMFGSNFYGGTGIIGAQVPCGVGIALSYKYRNQDAVCLTLYGDGASNNGQVFEALNIAKLWEIPCIFLCENNQYGMGTSVNRASANPELYTKGDYVPGVQADGMDFFSMKEIARFAVEHCTSGKGPITVEAQTYRYYGHSMSDPGTSYRTRQEVEEMRKNRDPITNYKEKILSAGLATNDELKKIDTEIKNEIEKNIDLANKDKEVPLTELVENIYANDVIKEVRLPNPFKMGVHKTAGRSSNLK